jgi:myo-inositol-1-phosphate synthase
MSFGSRLRSRGITQAIFKRLRKRAAQIGIPVSSQAGEAKKDGITIQWKYDPSAELLEVECVHAPFWIDATRVNRTLSEEIEATMETRSAA